MPRPGPRPYECVRRAWHSDRHQPIRGSLIQEIFRLANEVHSCATRKNKEWQEKLPFVVLKAEEIMYSKANSEAEYVDLKTLWDRANEAIDTIIRKDDANESEDLLQPCIEAALNLGCIPRRASRSQRHNNPVCYLSSNSKEAADVSHRSRENKANQLCSTSLLPTLLPMQSDCLHECAAQFGSKNLATGSEIQFMLSSASKGIHESSENSFKGLACNVGGLSVPIEPCISPNFGRIYSLYYGEVHSTSSLPQSHMSPQEQTRMNTFCAFGNMFDGSASVFESAKTKKLIYGTECDLSLRLGLPSCRSLEHEGFLGHEVDDVGSSSSCDGGKSCGPLSNGAGTMSFGSPILSAREKGFDFFLPGNIDKHHSSYSTSRWRSQRDCAFFMNNACDKNQNVYASGALTDERFI